MKRLMLLFTLSLILTNCLVSQQGYLKDKFYVGFHSFLYWSDQRQWSEFQNLNVNMMQIYGENHWDHDP